MKLDKSFEGRVCKVCGAPATVRIRPVKFRDENASVEIGEPSYYCHEHAIKAEVI